MKTESKKNYTISIAVIIIFVLIGISVGFLSTRYLVAGFKYTKNYTISYSNLPQNADPEDYTDSTIAVIQSPEFLNKLELEDTLVEAKKIAPFVIRITTTNKVKGVNLVVQQKVEIQFNDQSSSLFVQNIKLNSIGVPTQEHFEKLSSKIMATIGAIVGLFCALIMLLITKILEI